MLEDLLRDGWNYHDTETPRLAAQLEAAAAGPVADAALVPLLNLSNHAIGEHLGDWPRALRLAEQLLRTRVPEAETAGAWARLAIARALGGDPLGAAQAEMAFARANAAGPMAAQIEARFLLVAALTGSGRTAEATQLYAVALALAADAGEAAPSRAIAVASNNLAAELIDKPVRTADEDALMRAAAEAAHLHWRRCGTWVNEVRALHMRALAAIALGEAREARDLIDTALLLVDANSRTAVDIAFLHLARAQAQAQLGDGPGRDADLAQADAIAAGYRAEGMRAWYAAERARVTGAAA